MKLPNPFESIRPPKLSEIIKKQSPLHAVIEDAKKVITGARGEIDSVASALSGGAPPSPPTPPMETEPTEITEEIRGGTAGIACAMEHIGDVAASDIAEALRMARSRGIKDPEVRQRLMRARQELNQMERDDLTPEKIVNAPKEEQELARWVLPRSAAMRHALNEILMMDKEIEDLEKLAAYANETAIELTNRVDRLPPEQKASDECLAIKGLKAFLEERKLKKGGK